MHAGSRTGEAERILEAAGGEVRFSSGLADSDYRDDGMVEVFGTVGRDYPGLPEVKRCRAPGRPRTSGRLASALSSCCVVRSAEPPQQEVFA